MTCRRLLFAAFACLCSTAAPASAIQAPPIPAAATAVTPWDSEFARFASSDAADPPPAGAVLFVGSSSIRLWNDLEDQFKGQRLILKRGFGGSQLSDCVQHLNRLVVRYRPRTVLVYAGDNDLAAGATPMEVTQRFVAFVRGVHSALPETTIAYISIKPSPSRATLLPQIRAANASIREYITGNDKLAYIDVFTPMVDASGHPRRELFITDALHLNSAGYELWRGVIAPYLR